MTTSVLALCGSMLLLRESVAVLKNSQEFLLSAQTEMKGDLRKVRDDVAELQGRRFRGVGGYGTDQQKEAP